MKTRIIKEARTLLPAFALVLGATFVEVLVQENPRDPWSGLMIFLFVTGCIVMGAETFGNEFQKRTMPLLLSQPVPRAMMWREKMRILACALAFGAAVLAGAVYYFNRRIFELPDFPSTVFAIGFALIPLCAFGTAPFWTLTFRSTLLGAVFTLLAPAVLVMLNAVVHEYVFNRNLEDEHSINAFLYSAFALVFLYSAVCCWLGFRLFTRLQVVGISASREVALPAQWENIFIQPFRKISARFTGPFAALVKKELRLQQVSFLGAGLFVAVAIASTLLYQCHIGVGAAKMNVAEPILISDFAIYVLLLPLISGSLAIAEEKSWGVADWQVTLPPSLRKQWFAKILVTLSTSLVLGLALPALAYLVGDFVLHGISSEASANRPFIVPLLAVLLVIVVHLLLTSVVVYAASFCNSTVNAVLLSVAMLVTAGIVIRIGLFFPFYDYATGVQSIFASDQKDVEIKITLLAVELAGLLFLLWLVQRFAFACYRNRGWTLRRRLIQACALGGILFVLAAFTSLLIFAFFA